MVLVLSKVDTDAFFTVDNPKTWPIETLFLVPRIKSPSSKLLKFLCLRKILPESRATHSLSSWSGTSARTPKNRQYAINVTKVEACVQFEHRSIDCNTANLVAGHHVCNCPIPGK